MMNYYIASTLLANKKEHERPYREKKLIYFGFHLISSLFAEMKKFQINSSYKLKSNIEH